MKRVTLTATDPAVVAKIDSKASAQLQQLVNATPAQIDTWLSANVTTLAEARNALKVILLGLRYLLRRDV